MANLSVINGVLKYKETSYQISQMTSVKPVTVSRERKINYVSLRPVLPLIFISGLSGMIGLSIFVKETGAATVFLCASIAILIFCYKRVTLRMAQNREDTHILMYGISMYLANGDRELFVSSNKQMILDICDGIDEAMKGNSGNLVDFTNAKIEINNSDGFVFGSIDA